MPYLNSLATQYGLATQDYANTHPSIGSYFMLTTGQLVTTNDGLTGTVNVDNIVRELLACRQDVEVVCREQGEIRIFTCSGMTLARFLRIADHHLR
jgi:hypothetical protein